MSCERKIHLSLETRRERKKRTSYGKFLGDLLKTRTTGECFAFSDAFEESRQRDPFEIRSTLADVRRGQIVEKNESDIAIVVSNVRMVKTTEIGDLFQRLLRDEMR